MEISIQIHIFSNRLLSVECRAIAMNCQRKVIYCDEFVCGKSGGVKFERRDDTCAGNFDCYIAKMHMLSLFKC
jgi:hypothetical protein